MKKNKIINGIIFTVIFFLVTTVYIWMFIKSGSLDPELTKLDKITSNLDSKVIILIITTILTIVSLLIEYLIAKFLLVIFFREIAKKAEISDAIIPKIIIYILNILILLFLSLNYIKFFSITAIIGSFITFLFFRYKNKNLFASIMFTAPFLVDTVYSAFKTFLQ